MKQTIICGRCQSKIDIEEGMKIGTCASPLNKPYRCHIIEVDPKTDRGSEIASYWNRKPTIVNRG